MPEQTIRARFKHVAKKRPSTGGPVPPARVARMLALAYEVEAQIEDGKIRNYAHAARLLGVSRARISQIIKLLDLPTQIQGQILLGQLQVSERALRADYRR